MKAISEGKIIGIDTMVFIYHLENHPEYSRITERLFEGIEKAKYRAVTSFITLLEILVKPKRERALKAVSDYRDLLLTFPNLTFLPLELKVSDLASTLRAEYPIRTPDAIQIATSITGQASVFITNDEQLKKVDKINILLLRELTK